MNRIIKWIIIGTLVGTTGSALAATTLCVSATLIPAKPVSTPATTPQDPTNIPLNTPSITSSAPPSGSWALTETLISGPTSTQTLNDTLSTYAASSEKTFDSISNPYRVIVKADYQGKDITFPEFYCDQPLSGTGQWIEVVLDINGKTCKSVSISDQKPSGSHCT